MKENNEYYAIGRSKISPSDIPDGEKPIHLNSNIDESNDNVYKLNIYSNENEHYIRYGYINDVDNMDSDAVWDLLRSIFGEEKFKDKSEWERIKR